MFIQCPKCKRIMMNGKFVMLKENARLLPGISYKLCTACKLYLNRIQSIF